MKTNLSVDKTRGKARFIAFALSVVYLFSIKGMLRVSRIYWCFDVRLQRGMAQSLALRWIPITIILSVLVSIFLMWKSYFSKQYSKVALYASIPLVTTLVVFTTCYVVGVILRALGI